MEINDTKAELIKIQSEIDELISERRALLIDLSNAVGTIRDSRPIDQSLLLEMALEIRELNTELQELSDKRRSIRDARRAEKPKCDCNCH